MWIVGALVGLVYVLALASGYVLYRRVEHGQERHLAAAPPVRAVRTTRAFARSALGNSFAVLPSR